MSARGKSHQHKRKPKPLPASHAEIQLQNPVTEHFETFIVGNAINWQVCAMVELEHELPPEAYAPIRAAFDSHRPGMAFAADPVYHDALVNIAAMKYTAMAGTATGQHLVLCGAGPSLAEHAAEYCPQGDQVWGCNSAMTWLHEHGHKVTHGFTVDQTPHMVSEWASVPDVDYLIASTVHPHLTELLMQHERRFRFFHNFVGLKKPPVRWANAEGAMHEMPYEDWLYTLLFPPSVRAGSGLNAVTRAIDVAKYMGFAKITVLGADCCLRVKARPEQDFAIGSPEQLEWLRENTVMHADGGHALASEASPLVLSAMIDGRFWMTKTDMAVTAQWLVRMARAAHGAIRLIGDTLPNALLDKDEAFLRRLPNFTTSDGQIANIPVYDGWWTEAIPNATL